MYTMNTKQMPQNEALQLYFNMRQQNYEKASAASALAAAAMALKSAKPRNGAPSGTIPAIHEWSASDKVYVGGQ